MLFLISDEREGKLDRREICDVVEGEDEKEESTYLQQNLAGPFRIDTPER